MSDGGEGLLRYDFTLRVGKAKGLGGTLPGAHVVPPTFHLFWGGTDSNWFPTAPRDADRDTEPTP